MFKLFTPLLILLLVSISLLILEERKTFDISTLVQIDPLPKVEKLIAEKKYAQAEEYLSYFINYDYVLKNPKSLELMQTIQTKRDSLPYQTEKVMQGILEGKSDETVGEIAAVISDFLVFGDLRDLSIQGMHYLKNEETDNFLVALSSLGLIATVSTAYTAGASSPIKGSISFLKYAKRANKIPLWFQTKLMKQIDIAKDKKSLINVQTLLTPIHKLYDKTGFTQAMNLMSKSRNIKELTLLSKFGTRFKKKSQVLLSTSNNTAIKYMQKMPNVSTKNFLYASTYGEQGLKGMHKLGTNKFMKRVGFNSNLAKTTYKGNLNALFNALLKNIPNSLLYAISLFGLFYFIRKFFTLKKKLFS